MVDFFNDALSAYKLYVDWLFTFKLSGISVGYIILALIVFGIVFHYILGRIK